MTDSHIRPLHFEVEAFVVTIGHHETLVYARRGGPASLWDATVSTPAGSSIGIAETALAAVEAAVERHKTFYAFSQFKPTKLTLDDLDIE